MLENAQPALLPGHVLKENKKRWGHNGERFSALVCDTVLDL